MRKGDQVAARAPFWRGGATSEEADAVLFAAIGVHDIDLLAARPVAFEHDFSAFGRIGTADVDAGRIGQLLAGATLCRNTIDVGIAAYRHRIQNPLAIGRPARRKGGIAAFGDETLGVVLDIVNVNARSAVKIA